MKRDGRGDDQWRIVRDTVGTAVAEIGSRVFPLRAPPGAMPSVGTRRSTRVFVPKAAAKPGGDADPQSGAAAATVLRSGKRLPPSEPLGKKASSDGDDWLRVWWKKGDEEGFGEVERCEPILLESDADVAVESLQSVQEKASGDTAGGRRRFGVVYNRKKRRSRGDERDRKYGIVFVRKQRTKRPKVMPLVEDSSRRAMTSSPEPEEFPDKPGTRDWEVRITDKAMNLAGKMGILEDDLWLGLNGPMVVLAVLVESSRSYNSYHFGRFLVSVMSWMSRTRVRFWELAAFILSGPMANVFSLHGIHFLPLRRWKDSVVTRKVAPACGLCTILGSRESIPLITMDFSALPFYFRSLHMSFAFSSMHLPSPLLRYVTQFHSSQSSVAVDSQECDSCVPAETGVFGTQVVVSVNSAMKRNKSFGAVGTQEPVAQRTVSFHGAKFSKHQRKRSNYNRSKNGKFASKTCIQQDALVEAIRVKPMEYCGADFFLAREGNGLPSPLGSNQKQKKSSQKTPIEQIKELKAALAEVKKSIDSVRCNANILVTVSDRCWREEGAEIMLESSGSAECRIVVKREHLVRYFHKPQDMRPPVVNRFTHDYMWSGEDGWKLEFSNRWDWLVFKELLMECRERNAQDGPARMIPVPGVVEVLNYEDQTTASFLRPDQYVCVKTDEVERAMTSEFALYDMDSGDEEWLEQLNSSSFHEDDDEVYRLSEENFEKIISTFEKNAFNHPDDLSDKEKALSLCPDIGKTDMVATVFDYWLKKRKQKRASLIRVFQGPPPRRTKLAQQQFLRKKRSFKRQRSQGGRGKPEFFFDDRAEQEALSRVQEAEAAATRAVEYAISLRNRAQILMGNAELEAYKSVMALRLTDAIKVSESPELASSILD